MELKAWIKLEAGRTPKLLAHLNSVVATIEPGKTINPGQLSGWIAEADAKNRRTIPAYIAPAIEDYTRSLSGGDDKLVVMRWDSRPEDWFTTWPELIEHPRRPRMPNESVKAFAQVRRDRAAA